MATCAVSPALAAITRVVGFGHHQTVAAAGLQWDARHNVRSFFNTHVLPGAERTFFNDALGAVGVEREAHRYSAKNAALRLRLYARLSGSESTIPPCILADASALNKYLRPDTPFAVVPLERLRAGQRVCVCWLS
jgi:hypothetical protein